MMDPCSVQAGCVSIHGSRSRPSSAQSYRPLRLEVRAAVRVLRRIGRHLEGRVAPVRREARVHARRRCPTPPKALVRPLHSPQNTQKSRLQRTGERGGARGRGREAPRERQRHGHADTLARSPTTKKMKCAMWRICSFRFAHHPYVRYFLSSGTRNDASNAHGALRPRRRSLGSHCSVAVWNGRSGSREEEIE